MKEPSDNTIRSADCVSADIKTIDPDGDSVRHAALAVTSLALHKYYAEPWTLHAALVAIRSLERAGWTLTPPEHSDGCPTPNEGGGSVGA